MSNNHVHPTMGEFLNWFSPKAPAPEPVQQPTEAEILAGEQERLQRQREQERIAQVSEQEMDAMRRAGWL